MHMYDLLWCFLVLTFLVHGDRDAKYNRSGDVASSCHGWVCYDPDVLSHPKPRAHVWSDDVVQSERQSEDENYCGLPVFPAQDIPLHMLQDSSWSEKPFVLRGDVTLQGLKSQFARARILSDSKKHKLKARVGTSSEIVLNKGEGKQVVALHKYLNDLIHDARFDGETRLEFPYLFDRHSKIMGLPGYSFPVHEMITSWNESAFTPANTRPIFLVGGADSGVGFHRHAAALQMTIHGWKRWFFYHPSKYPPGGVHGAWSILDWLNHVYVTLGEHSAPIECIQQPGDIMHIPEGWYHAVVNLADSVAVSIQRNSLHTEFLDLEFAAKSAKDISKQSKRLKRLLKLQPDNVEAKYQLFKATKDSKPAKAMQIANEVLSNDPFLVDIQHDLANYLADMARSGDEVAANSFDKYLAEWKPYLENNTRNVQATQLLSQYHFLAGNSRESGIEYLKRGVYLQQNGFNMPNMPDFRQMLESVLRAA